MKNLAYVNTTKTTSSYLVVVIQLHLRIYTLIKINLKSSACLKKHSDALLAAKASN